MSPCSCSLFPIRPTQSLPLCGLSDDEGWEDVQDSRIVAEGGNAPKSETGDTIDLEEDEVVQKAVPMLAPMASSKSEVDCTT